MVGRPTDKTCWGRHAKTFEKALGEPRRVDTTDYTILNPADHTPEEIDAWLTNKIYKVLYYPGLVVKINAKGIVVRVEETKE